MKRIETINESPCYKCNCMEDCSIKVNRSPVLQQWQDTVFSNADFDYHDCGIWIALNAPEMVEVDEW